MKGAILGDIIGSPYEFESNKVKDFPLFNEKCRMTDDSYMTIAVACACSDSDLQDEATFKSDVAWWMRRIGRQYPRAGYGGMFYRWLISDIMPGYNSFGNGSAMRVSPVAWVAKSLEEAEKLAAWSAEVTHNHSEGIKGAKSVAAAIFLARQGKTKEEIKEYIEKNYYTLDFIIDDIRPKYKFDVTCQGSVPEAIQCFMEAESFEETIRNAVSLGGDSDTQAAIAGSIAEAYYGIPEKLANTVNGYMKGQIIDYYKNYAIKVYGKRGEKN